MAKLAFQWIYRHVLLPGRDLPGISSQLHRATEDPIPVTEQGEPR
jgi:hypothetical protein